MSSTLRFSTLPTHRFDHTWGAPLFATQDNGHADRHPRQPAPEATASAFASVPQHDPAADACAAVPQHGAAVTSATARISSSGVGVPQHPPSGGPASATCVALLSDTVTGTVC